MSEHHHPHNKRWTQRPEGSNWGDFGPDDELGRMGTITPEMRLAAIAEVKEGKSFVLSLPLDLPGGEPEGAGRFGPKLWPTVLFGKEVYNLQMTDSDICCDDGVTMCLQYSTQWDSLAHWGRLFDVDGSGVPVPVYYNGFRPGIDVLAPQNGGPPSANKLGIEKMAETCVQGRGVMVDLARAFGTKRIPIGMDKFEQAMKQQNVTVKKGDFLLLNTGYGDYLMGANKKHDPHVMENTACGLDGSDEALLNWIEQSGVVALISDNQAVEVFDTNLSKTGHNGLLPLHDRCLFKLGIHLGEMFWTCDLARHLAKVNRHAFLFTGPPLRLPGAVGSPASAVALV